VLGRTGDGQQWPSRVASHSPSSSPQTQWSAARRATCALTDRGVMCRPRCQAACWAPARRACLWWVRRGRGWCREATAARRRRRKMETEAGGAGAAGEAWAPQARRPRSPCRGEPAALRRTGRRRTASQSAGSRASTKKRRWKSTAERQLAEPDSTISEAAGQCHSRFDRSGVRSSQQATSPGHDQRTGTSWGETRSRPRRPPGRGTVRGVLGRAHVQTSPGVSE